MDKSEQWPQTNHKTEDLEVQLDATFEKAEGALKSAIIEKIKNSSDEEAKIAIDDLLIFSRVSEMLIKEDPADDNYDIEVVQKQIDEIGKKYGVTETMFSVEKIRKLTKQI